MGENGSQWGFWFVPSSIHPLFLSQLSYSADLAVAVFLTLTAVMSVLGNGIVLLVYYRKRKKLRPPELMTINLALCDFGFSLLGAPFFIISSLCHAWVFGEMGCLWYGIQGFVFGIGSLLTTCLISVDRCLKICCLRYGQWIEKRHLSLSIALVWVYTFFWALLPAFGFGSYGPEPYGTSCTINWWRMRSSLSDRIYIFLILTLCFAIPTLTIVFSYLIILLTVYRSNRTLASIAPSFVSHSSKDVRLAKIAAVVFTTFIVSWMPYAAVSLISAIIPRDEQEAQGTLQTVAECQSTGMTSCSSNAPKIPDIPSLVNWTATEYYRQIYDNPENKWSGMNNITSASIKSSLDEVADLTNRSAQPFSSLPPVFTLIPSMFAKSHCMINPFIYQIMNREFRDYVYLMMFGKVKAEKRRAQKRKESERSISLSECQSWKSKRSIPRSPLVESKNSNLKEQKNQKSIRGGETDSSTENDTLELESLNVEGLETEIHCSIRVHSQLPHSQSVI